MTCIYNTLYHEKIKKQQENAVEWSASWNVPIENIKAAQEKSENLRKIFIFSKGLSEAKFQTLFYQSSELEQQKSGKPLKKPFLLKKNPYINWWTTNDHAIARAAQQTMDQLVLPFNHALPEIPSEMSFKRFLNNNPQWKESCFVFFRDHPKFANRNDILIQRRQLTGNCYIHSPIVAHYYIMCMNFPDAKPIDIRNYILSHLDNEHLAKLITGVGGGSSRQIFQHILGDKVELISTSFSSEHNDIEEHLKKFGPGLVVGFQVEKEFHSDQSTHKGSFVSDEVIGSHSMIVVGYRVEKDTGKAFVLCQNWWYKKQFVECDTEYFRNSTATILFCKGDVGVHNFQTTRAVYDEGNFDNDDQCQEETKL